MESSAENYRIRTAEPRELLLLRKIEDDASTRFLGLGLIEDESSDSSFPLDELARLIEKRQVWVVCPGDNVPVGMILASGRDGLGYVEELDVLPEHGKRGLGSRLLEHACSWAKEKNYPAIALSTFSTVPWNAPFYRRRGFRDLAEDEWTASMPEIRKREIELGLKADARVFMRREL
jgi:GNAT superfamily N-acetyltransferase